jgi:hypothetical protein
VEVIIYTHSLGGLTENDFILAQAIDRNASVIYSKKFLRENEEVHNFHQCLENIAKNETMKSDENINI